MAYDASVVDGFTKILSNLHQPLRACYPRDIIQHICWKAKYEGKQPLLNLDSVQEACNNYFLSPSSDED